MIKTFFKISFITAALAMLAIYFFSQSSNFNITVNGEQIHDMQGAGMAFGGAMLGVIAVCFAIVLVGVALVGASVLVIGILGMVGILLMMLFSPLLIPFGVLLLIVVLLKKRNRH